MYASSYILLSMRGYCLCAVFCCCRLCIDTCVCLTHSSFMSPSCARCYQPQALKTMHRNQDQDPRNCTRPELTSSSWLSHPSIHTHSANHVELRTAFRLAYPPLAKPIGATQLMKHQQIRTQNCKMQKILTMFI